MTPQNGINYHLNIRDKCGKAKVSFNNLNFIVIALLKLFCQIIDCIFCKSIKKYIMHYNK